VVTGEQGNVRGILREEHNFFSRRDEFLSPCRVSCSNVYLLSFPSLAVHSPPTQHRRLLLENIIPSISHVTLESTLHTVYSSLSRTIQEAGRESNGECEKRRSLFISLFPVSSLPLFRSLEWVSRDLPFLSHSPSPQYSRLKIVLKRFPEEKKTKTRKRLWCP